MQYYRKEGTTQIVTETGEVTTDPSVMKEIGEIGNLPIWEEKKPSTVLRYGGTNKMKELAEGLDTTMPTAQEEVDIREKTRKELQAQIDAIAQMYTTLATREEKAGEERLGMTRATAARGGLLGSDFGIAQMGKTREFTSEQIKLLREEQQVRVQGILSKADERATREIELKKAETRENIETYMKYLSDIRDEAKDDWSGLATSGMSLDRIKTNKNYYNQALEELGMNNLEFDFWYEAKLPKGQQLDYSEIQYRGENDNIWLKRIGFDPVTGEKKEYNYDIGLSWPTEPMEIKVFDGIPYKAVKDTKGNVIKYERVPGVEEKRLKRSAGDIFEVIRRSGKTAVEVNAMGDEEFAKHLGTEKPDIGTSIEAARAYIEMNKDTMSYWELYNELSKDENLKSDRIKSILEEKEIEKEEEKEEKKEFLSKEYFRKAYTDEQLRNSMRKMYSATELSKMAREAGYARAWKGKAAEVDLYLEEKGADLMLDYYMGMIEQYREAGHTDREILKMIT